MPQRATPEERELVLETDNAALYRVRKEYPDGSGYVTFYRGRSYIKTEDGSRMETPEKPDFKTEAEGLEWLEQHK